MNKNQNSITGSDKIKWRHFSYKVQYDQSVDNCQMTNNYHKGSRFLNYCYSIIGTKMWIFYGLKLFIWLNFNNNLKVGQKRVCIEITIFDPLQWYNPFLLTVIQGLSCVCIHYMGQSKTSVQTSFLDDHSFLDLISYKYTVGQANC